MEFVGKNIQGNHKEHTEKEVSEKKKRKSTEKEMVEGDQRCI